MTTPFKLKYKNSAFPFKNGKKTKEEKEQKRRVRKVRISQKLGETVPTTKENLKQHLDYFRGSQDLFV